jgi:hypothetical protein
MEELRISIQLYVLRLNSIIRRLASINLQGRSSRFHELCIWLGQLNPDEQDAFLSKAEPLDAYAGIQLVDPATITRPQAQRKIKVQTLIVEPPPMTVEQRREAFVNKYIREQLDIDDPQTQEYVAERLVRGERVRLSQLPVQDYKQVLANLRATTVGHYHEGMRYRFAISTIQAKRSTPYFEGDDFNIELLEVNE